MNKRRFLYAGAGLAFSALIATLVVFVSVNGGGLAGRQGSDYWAKRITACQDSSLQTTEEVLAHSYDCLKSTIRDAVFNESFDNWVAAATPIMAEDIKFEYVCHIPGHDLGAELNEFFGGDYTKAIMTLGWDICGGGIVHGIFDVWGKTQHSDVAWLQIGLACIEQNKLRYSTCGDAVGHAAYESKGQDLAAAIGVCDTMPEDWIRNSCANGAFMQKYYPQSSALKYTRVAVIPPWEELVEFCDTLPYRNAGTRDGCYGGAGWVMGNTIFHELAPAVNSGNEYDSTPEADRRALDLAAKAIAACEVNVSSGTNLGNPDVCIDLVLVRMPLFWYMNTEKFIGFCEELNTGRAEMFMERCLAGGLEHLTPDAMAELERRYPGVSDVLVYRNPVTAGLVGEFS